MCMCRDEPTNHLDSAAIRWLGQFLRASGGTLVIVSHDEQLLEDVCDHIAEVRATHAVPMQHTHAVPTQHTHAVPLQITIRAVNSCITRQYTHTAPMQYSLDCTNREE